MLFRKATREAKQTTSWTDPETGAETTDGTEES